MKRVISSFIILIIILLYTNSTYALINDYISLDSDGYEVSGENDNLLLKDKYKENSTISIIVKQNPYGIMEITDDIFYSSEEIERDYGTPAKILSKNPKITIGKNNKYYKCGEITYCLDELKLFICQYLIPTDNFIYAITICSPEKNYLTDDKILNLLNSITIQDTITYNDYNEKTENTNTILLEDSISAGTDGIIKGAIIGRICVNNWFNC